MNFSSVKKLKKKWTFETFETKIHHANFFFQTDLQIQGSIDISMKYKMPETLLVTVHKGSDLTNKYQDDGTPNPFIKMSIPGIAAAFKTKVLQEK